VKSRNSAVAGRSDGHFLLHLQALRISTTLADTTKLYDRTGDEIMLDEVERITI
jgi:hypothetical protein